MSEEEPNCKHTDLYLHRKPDVYLRNGKLSGNPAFQCGWIKCRKCGLQFCFDGHPDTCQLCGKFDGICEDIDCCDGKGNYIPFIEDDE